MINLCLPIPHEPDVVVFGKGVDRSISFGT